MSNIKDQQSEDYLGIILTCLVRVWSLIILLVGETMGIFSGLYKIIVIKVFPQLINFIPFLINNIKMLIGRNRIKARRILVPRTKGIIHMICILIESLWIWVIVFLIIPHWVDIIVRVCRWRVILITLTGVLKLSELEGLLDEDILDIIWQVIYFVLAFIFISILVLQFTWNFHFQILYLHLVEKTELWTTHNPLWFLRILAVRVFVIIVTHVIVLLAFLRFQTKWKIAH